MPVTVQHVLTATTPDDPTYEIRPTHWNSAHAMTLSLAGSEVSQVFSNSPTVSFGMSGTAITASANVTAAPSPVNVTGVNGSSVNAQTIAFSQGNGVTLGVSTAANAATITASHNGLTSQSNQAASAANGSFAFQTLSFSNLNGISFGTSAGSAITASHNALTSQSNQAASASNGSFTFQTLGFSNANQVTFGTSAGSIITASIAGTSSLSATGAISISANADTISIGVPQLSLFASSNTTAQSSSSSFSLGSLSIRGAGGVSVGFSAGEIVVSGGAGGAGDGVNIIAAGTQTANTTGSVLFQNSNGITFGMSNSSVVTASHNGLTSQSNQAVTAANGSFAFQTLSFSNLNGISFGTSAGSAITASHNALTTARASTDAIGLNTAQTNVTWTVNSSGLSLNAAGYAGTGTTFNGANISGSMTQNSVGLQLSLSVAAPGAAAENNAINLLGANTAGNTTATGSTIGWSGINLTLSGTNNSVVNISAPATSSLVGSSGLSISTNGSTITAYAVARSQWNNFGPLSAQGTAIGNSLVSIQPFRLEWPLVVSNALIPISVNVATTTLNSTAFVDVSMSGVVYSRNASTLSNMFSFSQTLTQTFSSNATGTVTGVKGITATFPATTMTPGDYWLALHMSTTNSATGGANTTALANTISMIQAYALLTVDNLMALWGNQTNATYGLVSGLGVVSTGATVASIPFSSITVTGTRGAVAPVAFGLRNETYQ